MGVRVAAALLALALAAAAQQVVVVAPDEFRPLLKEWTALRESQGFKVKVQPPGAPLEKGGGIRFLLLLGDARKVPCGYFDASSIAPYERNPRCPSDNGLADLDGDRLPDVAVGRLPARTPQEASLLLGKVVAYERSRDFGAWRRRLNVVAGVAGFGFFEDLALELTTKQFLTESVPDAVDVTMTYANERSPWCPPPAEIGDTVIERFNEGALAVAYLGHGHSHGLDRMRWRGQSFRILTQNEAVGLDAKHGPPLAFFIACSTGAFDEERECLAEAVLKQPGGPVAAVAASRVSMPYANGIFAKELVEALFGGARTLGEVFLAAKRRLVDAPGGDLRRGGIELVARSVYEPSEERRRAERVDHLYLYNLLGDPCLTLALPRPAEVSWKGDAKPGGFLDVTARSPVAGKGLLELAESRGTWPPPRPPGADDPESFRKTYERANRRVVLAENVEVKAAGASVRLKLPPDLPPGEYVVRLFVEGEGAAMAAARVTVKP